MTSPSRHLVQRLDSASLMRLAAATGHALDIDRGGPALAHWAWFHDLVAAADIGPDGHPKPSVLLPATGKPRRMFASATISFEAPFELGELADFEERVADQRTRHGLSGELVLMEIERRISQHGKTRIVENRTLVYRDSGGTTPPVSANAGFDGNWRPREVDLFRFSAATFNSHRIHYDRAYAQIEEGYPDLVVHGPFTACKLADLAAQEGPLETFAFRAEAPLFVGQVVRLERQGESFVAIRCDGAVAMTATATWKS